jgi:DNA-binding MarR family transcriptional regulator
MLKSSIEQVILFQIEVTNKKVKQYSQKEFDRLKLGITVDQWVLLKILDEAEEMSQMELANKSKRNPASITRTLDLLEKKDLVVRENIQGNRRQYQIVLSKQGKQFVTDNMPLILAQRAQSTKGFTKTELNALSSYLQRIQDNMT